MLVFTKPTKPAGARAQINIREVRDGILCLPNHSYRLVLRASALNFELKSEFEQDNIIDMYQSFLNSLSLPIQILVRIRETDIDRYVAAFESRVTKEKETVYKQQLKNYVTFVKGLVKNSKVLARHFYIVVPYVGSHDNFEVIGEQLTLDADIVAKSLSRIGIRTQQLTSLEILDLFYSFYNPSQAKSQPLTEQTIKLLNLVYA